MSANELDRLRRALDAANSWAELHSDDCPHRDCTGKPREACDDCLAEPDEEPCTPDVCAGAAFIELAAAARAVLDSERAATIKLETIDALQTYVARGRKKFTSGRFLFAALVEEVGELADAIMAGDVVAVRREATDVACVAIRITEEGECTPYDARGIIACASRLGSVARALLQRRTPTNRALETFCDSIVYLLSGGDRSFADITEEESQP